MIRKEIIRKRLNKLDEYLSILYSMQRYKFDEYIKSPERYGSAERFLHLAIESLIDIGNHIVADDQLGTVNWYSDIPKILEQKSYIDTDLCNKWIQMIGFRNTLVHAYLDIDRSIVYDVLQNRLEDIEALRKVFGHFL